MKTPRVFKCKQCEHEETSHARLLRHVQDAHPPRGNIPEILGNVFICPQGCGFESDDKKVVMNHQKSVHTDSKRATPNVRAQCKMCPWQATASGSVSSIHKFAHRTIHGMYCPYEGCKGARRTQRFFKSASALAVHLMTEHDDEEAAKLAREATYNTPWGQDIADRSRFDTNQPATDPPAVAGPSTTAGDPATEDTITNPEDTDPTSDPEN